MFDGYDNMANEQVVLLRKEGLTPEEIVAQYTNEQPEVADWSDAVEVVSEFLRKCALEEGAVERRMTGARD